MGGGHPPNPFKQSPASPPRRTEGVDPGLSQSAHLPVQRAHVALDQSRDVPHVRRHAVAPGRSALQRRGVRRPGKGGGRTFGTRVGDHNAGSGSCERAGVTQRLPGGRPNNNPSPPSNTSQCLCSVLGTLLRGRACLSGPLLRQFVLGLHLRALRLCGRQTLCGLQFLRLLGLVRTLGPVNAGQNAQESTRCRPRVGQWQ